MKRVLTFLALMLLPLSVMAMTPVSDSTLSDVTGQAGVNINADITMSINIGTMAWGDSDGLNNAAATSTWLNEATHGGYVGVTGFNITNLQIKARYDTNDTYNGYSTMFLKPITIDVASADKSARGGQATGETTFVRLGLGALKISLTELQFKVALGPEAATPVLGQRMGVVTLSAMDVYINPWSYVDIYAHGACGVTFDMNVIIDQLTLPAMSWGDTDGLGTVAGTSTVSKWMTGATDAGYVGVNGFSISADPSSAANMAKGAISMKGAVSIDVVTAAHGIYPDLQYVTEANITANRPVANEYLMTQILAGAGVVPGSDWAFIFAHLGLNYALVNPVTAIHISFATPFELHVGAIRGNVVLAGPSTNGNLNATGLATLGDFYLEKLDVTINQGSWVDIWAH